MASPNNAKVVGGFVIGALVLLVAAVVVFGSGALFRTTRPAVAYFEGSVAGLSVGSPVSFRGVPIGSVSRIVLEVSATNGDARIPVYLEFNPDAISFKGGTYFTPNVQKDMIARGLRAQLVSQSLITGQLMVQLDYFPGTKAVFVGENPDLLEIPTVPSEFQLVKSTLQSLPLSDIAQSMLGTLSSINAMLRSPEVTAAVKDLSASLAEVHTLLVGLQPQIRDTVGQTNTTMAAIARTADKATEAIGVLQPDAKASLASLAVVLGTADQQIKPLIAELRATIKSIDTTVQQANAALFTGVGVLAPRSPLRQNTEDMMRNLAAASTSLRSLAAELERNPNAVILGKRQ